jgi:YD repeat-containing protein
MAGPGYTGDGRQGKTALGPYLPSWLEKFNLYPWLESGLESVREALAIQLNGKADKSYVDTTFIVGNPTLTVTYNTDGSVATTTENGILTTFTYNPDGTVATQTRAGTTKTFTYNANGNVTGAI